MPNQNDPPDDNKLNEEELELLIRQKTLEALREIDDLIVQHENIDSQKESSVRDTEQKLYLRWKSGEEEG
jgi:hypothetical protein